jgi:exosortase A-associated hydrolase 1
MGKSLPVLFSSGGEELLGILTMPCGPPSPVGVLVVVGGPQYRVGSHRQFLQLSRFLAGRGVASFRFDTSGMGDSTGALRSFEHLTPDIAAAIDAFLQQAPNLESIVLLGLCDGASAALMAMAELPQGRVSGLCLVNPWVRTAATEASARVSVYYARRIRSTDFWRKLLRGAVSPRRLLEFVATYLQSRKGASSATGGVRGSFQTRMALGWRAFGGPVHLTLSGNDLTAREFIDYCTAHDEWQALLRRPDLTRLDIAEADHTLSNASSREHWQGAVADWLATIQVAPLRHAGDTGPASPAKAMPPSAATSRAA